MIQLGHGMAGTSSIDCNVAGAQATNAWCLLDTDIFENPHVLDQDYAGCCGVLLACKMGGTPQAINNNK